MFKKKPSEESAVSPDTAQPSAVNHEESVATTRPGSHDEPKRSNPILVTVLFLFVAGMAAVATYTVMSFVNGSTKQTPQPDVATTQKPVVASLTAQSVIDDIKKVFDGTTVTLEKQMTQPLKLAGYDFYVSAPGEKVLNIQKSAAATQSPVDLANITKVLTEKGFTNRNPYEKTAPVSAEEMQYVDYAHKDVVCRATVTKTANNPAGNHSISVSCANMSDYTARAKEAQPFYTLLPAENKVGGSGYFVLDKTADSKTANYKTAEATAGSITDGGDYGTGAKILYYQTPDKQWHFFKGTQQILACTDYTTTDLKNAYAGESCFDTTTGANSTVKAQ